MVIITITTNDLGEFMSLEAKGHTGMKGSSLLCAAISAIIKCGASALKDENAYIYEDKDGYFYLEATSKISEHDSIVIETIATQIECLAENHHDEMRLERKKRT